MEYKQWYYQVNKLDISNDVKDTIIQFYSKFSNKGSLDFIPISDRQLRDSFHNINNYKPLTVCLDIEFQSVENSGTERFIREIGILVFVKDKSGTIYYLGYVFINFPPLTEFGYDKNKLHLLGSKYSTVTSHSQKKMEHLEKQLLITNITEPLYSDILFDNKKKWEKIVRKIAKDLDSNYLFHILGKEIQTNIMDRLNDIIYYSDYNDVSSKLRYIDRQIAQIQYILVRGNLDNVGKELFDMLWDVYWSDRLVQDRIKILNDSSKKFMKLLGQIEKQSILVLKGKMDILALKSSCKLILGENILELGSYYDIETFNGFSNLHFKSSQLENTFIGLSKTPLYRTVCKPFFDKVFASVGEKAHNPVVDSVFTIVVALVVNLILNKGVVDQFASRGGYVQYVKYRKRYLDQKRQKD